jgi:hypothetical protein
MSRNSAASVKAVPRGGREKGRKGGKEGSERCGIGKGWREGTRGRETEREAPKSTHSHTHKESRIDSQERYCNKSKNKGGSVILPVMPERRGNSLKRFW